MIGDIEDYQNMLEGSRRRKRRNRRVPAFSWKKAKAKPSRSGFFSKMRAAAGVAAPPKNRGFARGLLAAFRPSSSAGRDAKQVAREVESQDAFDPAPIDAEPEVETAEAESEGEGEGEGEESSDAEADAMQNALEDLAEDPKVGWGKKFLPRRPTATSTASSPAPSPGILGKWKAMSAGKKVAAVGGAAVGLYVLYRILRRVGGRGATKS